MKVTQKSQHLSTHQNIYQHGYVIILTYKIRKKQRLSEDNLQNNLEKECELNYHPNPHCSDKLCIHLKEIFESPA